MNWKGFHPAVNNEWHTMTNNNIFVHGENTKLN